MTNCQDIYDYVTTTSHSMGGDYVTDYMTVTDYTDFLIKPLTFLNTICNTEMYWLQYYVDLFTQLNIEDTLNQSTITNHQFQSSVINIYAYICISV